MAKHGNRKTQDTVEITLERGQVTTLVVGSVLALGAVFLVGVAFGRRVTPAPAKGEAAAAAPAVAHAEAAAPAPVEPPPLTFHDTLTGRRIEARIAPRDEAKPAAPAKAATEETPALAKAEPPKPAPEAAPAPKAAPAEKPAVAAAKPAPATGAAPAAAGASEGGYSVQVASSRERGDTERLAQKLKAAGYAARVVAADIPGKGRWYRVRVGEFGSREDAAMKQAEIKLALNMAGLVVAE